MAQIHPRGKAQNKRFQFNAPADIVDEFIEKKSQLLKHHDLTVDLTEDFVKVIKDAIKQIDKRLSELSESQSGNNTGRENQHTNL